jgi:hypothetical protein
MGFEINRAAVNSEVVMPKWAGCIEAFSAIKI